MRLDKYLTEMGVGSRSDVKNLVRKGRIAVNDEIVKKPETKIQPGKDRIVCDGQEVVYVELEYYMLNKPQGVLTATTDKHAKTVLDLVSEKVRGDLFPVGRLDKDTEGLLLITNDGMLAHNLLSPKKHVDKVYYAVIDGRVENCHREEFKKGIVLTDGTRTMPAFLEILKSDTQSEIRLTIHEGKFHQVKRMFEAVGCRVIYLKRLRMGALLLDETLAPGEYRKLTEEEINAIKQ